MKGRNSYWRENSLSFPCCNVAELSTSDTVSPCSKGGKEVGDGDQVESNQLPLSGWHRQLSSYDRVDLRYSISSSHYILWMGTITDAIVRNTNFGIKFILHFSSETIPLLCFLSESEDKQGSNDQLTLSSNKTETDEPPLKTQLMVKILQMRKTFQHLYFSTVFMHKTFSNVSWCWQN